MMSSASGAISTSNALPSGFTAKDTRLLELSPAVDHRTSTRRDYAQSPAHDTHGSDRTYAWQDFEMEEDGAIALGLCQPPTPKIRIMAAQQARPCTSSGMQKLFKILGKKHDGFYPSRVLGEAYLSNTFWFDAILSLRCHKTLDDEKTHELDNSSSLRDECRNSFHFKYMSSQYTLR